MKKIINKKIKFLYYKKYNKNMENKWKENEIEIKHNTCFQKLRLKDDNSEKFFIQKKPLKNDCEIETKESLKK